jgi:hypothetical protein
LSPFTSSNSKWIKDLNIRPETLKLVKERAGITLEAIGIVQRLPQQKSTGSAAKRKDQQMGLHEIKNLLHSKRNGF